MAALYSIEPLDDEQRPERPKQQPSAIDNAALSAIMLALKALSQRAVIAIASLVNLAMVASVFWLFLSIQQPTTNQIIWGGMYAAFILTLVGFNIKAGR